MGRLRHHLPCRPKRMRRLAPVVLLASAWAVCAACDERTAAHPDGGGCTELCREPERCDPARGRCVRCTEDRHCEGGSLRCDPATGACVECTADSECPAIRPYCAAGSCIQCRESAECTTAERSRCDTAREIPTCMACVADADCAHLLGRPLCERGNCVECSSRDETACAPSVCDVRRYECTDRPMRSRGICEECVSDLECQEHQLCIEALDGPAPPRRPAECQWRLDAPPPGPAGSCFGVRPLVLESPYTSVGGVYAVTCRPTASCSALARFDVGTCAPGSAAESTDDCGDRGLCAPEGRCTYSCGSHEECPCADESCSGHFACTERYDAVRDVWVRACDLGLTSPLDRDPSCWTGGEPEPRNGREGP